MINKNVSIWRGTQTPPTNYHLWEKQDGSIYVYIDEQWRYLVAPGDKTTLDENKKLLDKLKQLAITEVNPSNTNTLKSYQLKSGEDTYGATIDIPKDKFIKQVTLGYGNASINNETGEINIGTGLQKEFLLFSIALESGGYELISINLSEFITEKDYSDGLEVVDNKLKVKKDTESEQYLGITSKGIKVSGIDSQFNTINTKLSDINTVLYTQHAKVNLTGSPTIIEKGVSTQINLSWHYIYNDKEMTPNSMQLKSGDIILESINKTYTDTISNSKSYKVVAVNQDITKESNIITVNAYYPMYFGECGANYDKATLITINNKRPIASSPRGDISITFTGGKYLWLCVPNTMTINKVTSSGFAVPMEAPIMQIINEQYKCYRSTDTINKGTVNFTIS